MLQGIVQQLRSKKRKTWTLKVALSPSGVLLVVGFVENVLHLILTSHRVPLKASIQFPHTSRMHDVHARYESSLSKNCTCRKKLYTVRRCHSQPLPQMGRKERRGCTGIPPPLPPPPSSLPLHLLRFCVFQTCSARASTLCQGASPGKIQH